MRLAVTVGNVIHPIDEPEIEDHEQMAANAVAHVFSYYSQAHMQPNRFFDVRFPNNEVIRFVSIDLNKWQRIPENFTVPVVPLLDDED